VSLLELIPDKTLIEAEDLDDLWDWFEM